MTTARDTQPPYQTIASAGGKLRKTLLQQKKNLNLLTKIVDREEGQRGNSAATRISDLEQMLQQKTFTRSEIERLKALLLSRSNQSSSIDVVERNGANLYSSPSSKCDWLGGKIMFCDSGNWSEIERLKALLLSRSNRELIYKRLLKRNGANLYSSPSSKVALRQALVLHNNATGL
ncbi:hypothetical protein Tco_0871262 [Tanacetum coccineum]